MQNKIPAVGQITTGAVRLLRIGRGCLARRAIVARIGVAPLSCRSKARSGPAFGRSLRDHANDAQPGDRGVSRTERRRRVVLRCRRARTGSAALMRHPPRSPAGTMGRERVTAAERKRRQRNFLPHLKIFLQKRLPQKGYPLSGAETVFGQVFGRGGMSNFQNPKVPPTGGSHLPHAHPSSFEMRRTVPVPTRGAGDGRQSTLISPEVAEPVG